MSALPGPSGRLPRRVSLRLPWLAGLVTLAGLLASPVAPAQIYRWVDDEGVIHLSSEKPPAGVKAERLDIPGGTRRGGTSASSGGTKSPGSGSSAARPVSPAQVTEREALLGRLRNRECVIALEALERKTSGSEPTSAVELRRLKQTAELNCSRDPARRLQQEEQARQLRMANSPSCVQARERLADLLAPGAGAQREQLRAQQAFVEEHCMPPVR